VVVNCIAHLVGATRDAWQRPRTSQSPALDVRASQGFSEGATDTSPLTTQREAAAQITHTRSAHITTDLLIVGDKVQEQIARFSKVNTKVLAGTA
jgi:hypothetical protein